MEGEIVKNSGSIGSRGGSGSGQDDLTKGWMKIYERRQK
jgi:hypothetical protein